MVLGVYFVKISLFIMQIGELMYNFPLFACQIQLQVVIKYSRRQYLVDDRTGWVNVD